MMVFKNSVLVASMQIELPFHASLIHVLPDLKIQDQL